MRSWFLPVLPVALVAVAFSFASSPSASGSVPRNAASFQTLSMQSDMTDGMRREVDPHFVASQYAR